MSSGILHLIISEIQVEYFRNNETTVTFHINEVPEALAVSELTMCSP